MKKKLLKKSLSCVMATLLATILSLSVPTFASNNLSINQTSYVFSSPNSTTVASEENQTEVKSNDANLSEIRIGAVPFPGFQANITSYTLIFPKTVPGPPVVQATAANENATIEITAATAIPGTTTIVVTAEDGTTKTYTLNFTLKKDDASLAGITVDGVPLVGFNARKTSYTVRLPETATAIPIVNATSVNANAAVTVRAATALPGTTTIVVTAEDGTTETYTVDFKVGTADVTLSEITVGGVPLEGFNPDKTNYIVEAASVPSVAATPSTANLRVFVNNAIAVPGTTLIAVISPDGALKQYRINFVIASSNGTSPETPSNPSTGINTPTPETTTAINTSLQNIISAINGVTSNGKVVVDIKANKSVAKEVFDALKDTNKTITFTQEGVEWSFNGKDITSSTKVIDMTVNVSKLESSTTKNKAQIENKLINKDILIISFANNGQLPGKAKVRIKLDAAWLVGKNRNNMNIYYYNETTKAIEVTASGLSVDADGYIVFDITHNSDYIVTDKALTTAPVQATTVRLGGANRYETSVKVSQTGWTTSDNVVIARGDHYADALTAAPFAKQLNAPILLTSTKALDSSVIAELKRLKVKKAYIIGGTGAISTAVENAVIAMGISTERLSGSDRYATSLAIANKMINKSQVFLATGLGFADTLSISSYAAATGRPILLTDKNHLTEGVAKFIKDHSSKVYLIGGTEVISEAAVKGITGIERIFGSDRYATNLAILNKFAAEFDFSNIYLTTGSNYPDAICGSALAGKENAPIILVNSKATANQKAYVNSIITKVSKVNVLGGEGTLSPQTISDILN